MIIWSLLRIYVSIHELLVRNLIFDMLAKRDVLDVTLFAVLFFFTSIFPYFLLFNKPIYRTFLKGPSRESQYEHMVHRNSDLTMDSVLN